MAVLASLAVGCGGTPTVEPSGNGIEPAAKAPTSTGYVSVLETTEDPGYCGYADIGTDELGNQIIEEERYYYPRINQILAANSDLVAALGTSSVADCETARKFMPLYNEYRVSHPEGSSADKRNMLAEIETAQSEASRGDVTGDDEEVPKMMGDVTYPIWREIIQWGWTASQGSNKGKSRQCSGIRLSGTLFLTAAHCMSTTGRAALDKPIDTFPISRIKHLTNDLSNNRGAYYPSNLCDSVGAGQTCIAQHVTAYMNPNYAGTGDVSNDLAVVHIDHDAQPSFRSAPEASVEFGTWVAWVSTKTPAVSKMVRMISWGPEGDFDSADPADWFMTWSAEVPIADVGPAPTGETNGFINGTYLDTVAIPGAQVCMGDSGGGSYVDEDGSSLLKGVLVAMEKPYDTQNPHCAAVGKKTYSTRTDYHIFSFIPRAVRLLQEGSDTSPCRCVFFAGSGDPTGINPEADGAHMRCNVGCEDPNAWTP